MSSTITFASSPTPGLVSIVVPTYCKERYIGETLATIGQQLYSNWEVIVVEDASQGATEQIVKDFARAHPAQRVDYSRNDRRRGASHSRNVAFTKARGEFIALLDSDDRWFPEHLTRSVTALQSTGKDIVYSIAVMIDDNTERVIGLSGPMAHEFAEFPETLYRRNYVTPSATVMRRDVLADVGLWDTTLRYCEDFDYWLRCLAAGKAFHLIGGCNCLYRKNHDGATTQQECGTREEYAEIAERYPNPPGLSKTKIRRNLAKSYRWAARCHAHDDPVRDVSANRSRAAGLMFKAWRLRPKRVDYLWEAVVFGLRYGFRARPRPTPAAIESAPVRAAA
jgi:glycosyltransferase involved in cell wall biosynthesis